MLGLPSEWYGALEFQYPPHQRQGSYEEEGRAINTMKARAWRPTPTGVDTCQRNACYSIAHNAAWGLRC